MEVAVLTKLQSDSWYAGDDGKGEYLFPLDLWIEFQQQLTTADVIMRMASIKYKMQYLTNIRGNWPARRLRKSKGLKFFEIRLLLNPNYLQDKEIFYELNEVLLRDWFGYFRKQLRFRKITRYSVEQMSDRDLLTNDLEQTISSLKS
jgi:hypothetical protein